MPRYENGTWKLLNVDDLPRFESGRYKGKIDCRRCVGMILEYELKANGVIYEIKIVDYNEKYRDKNGKQINPKFKVEYVYLKGTEYEEVIEKVIQCNHLINNVKIGGVVPSLNQWIEKGGYWEGEDIEGRKFKFNTDNKETIYKILHSTWNISGGYVFTGSLNNSKQNWKMHKAIYFNCNKEESDNNIHMCIDHINNDKTDNRIDNLRLATMGENSKNKKTNNKYGLVGLSLDGKSYYSQFKFEGYIICTRGKHDIKEAIIDNLIAQRFLGYKHNEDQFHKLKGLQEERIKEVTNLLDRKIEKNRNKIKKEKEYRYDYIEKNNLIGVLTFKKDGTKNPICWVDRNFGRIKGDEYVVNGTICNNGSGYFKYSINKEQYRIHNYVLIGEISLQNYRNNNFQIDHLNKKTNENYRDNLEIVTEKSNKMNKEGKGYYGYEIKSEIRYQVYYARNWEYFDLYIGGFKKPTFNTEEEAILEVKRRKEIVNKYRFRIGWQGSEEDTMKVLDEVIDFAEGHELDLDSAYIVWKGLDTLKNIKNYLNDIDK